MDFADDDRKNHGAQLLLVSLVVVDLADWVLGYCKATDEECVVQA